MRFDLRQAQERPPTRHVSHVVSVLRCAGRGVRRKGGVGGSQRTRRWGSWRHRQSTCSEPGGKGGQGTQAPHGGTRSDPLARRNSGGGSGRKGGATHPPGRACRQAGRQGHLSSCYLARPVWCCSSGGLGAECLGAPAGAPVRRPATASAQHLSGSSDRRDLPRSGTSGPPVDQVSRVWTPQRVWPPVL
jgi:hypothetical protein